MNKNRQGKLISVRILPEHFMNVLAEAMLVGTVLSFQEY